MQGPFATQRNATQRNATQRNATQRKRRRLSLEQLNARHMLAGDTLNYPPSLYQESFYLPHDTVLSGQINAYDPEGASLSPILLAVPSQGNLSINSDLTFEYIPNHNFAGSDSFTLAVFDGFNMSDSVTFHVEVTNYAPSAESSSFSTPHGVSLSASLVAYDYDGDPITASIDSLPANGTLSFNPDLTFSYQPNSGFSGTDSFSFIVSDGIASSSPIFVAINVTNYEPYAESSTLSTRHGTLLTGQLTGYDYDGDPFTASLVSEPTNGAILVNPDLSFSYQPQTGFVGTDSFSFVLFDGIASSYPATVTMNVVNSTPIAESGTFVLDGHGELSGSVYGYDYDGDSVVAQLISPTSSGTLILNPNFTFSYVPAENFNGFDSFSFVAFDGIEQSAAATVSIEVLHNTVVDLPEPPLPEPPPTVPNSNNPPPTTPDPEPTFPSIDPVPPPSTPTLASSSTPPPPPPPPPPVSAACSVTIPATSPGTVANPAVGGAGGGGVTLPTIPDLPEGLTLSIFDVGTILSTFATNANSFASTSTSDLQVIVDSAAASRDSYRETVIEQTCELARELDGHWQTQSSDTNSAVASYSTAVGTITATYESDNLTAHQDFGAASQTANTNLDTAINSANAVADVDILGYHHQYGNAIQQADADYAAALVGPKATMDASIALAAANFAAEQATADLAYDNDETAAYSTYNTTVAGNQSHYDFAETAAEMFFDAFRGTQESAHATNLSNAVTARDAVLTAYPHIDFWALIEADPGYEANTASALTTFNLTMDAQIGIYNTAYATAVSDFEAAYDTVLDAYNNAVATATSNHESDYANARTAYENSIHTAQADFDSDHDTFFGDYQTALANAETNYNNAVFAATTTFQNTYDSARWRHGIATRPPLKMITTKPMPSSKPPTITMWQRELPRLMPILPRQPMTSTTLSPPMRPPICRPWIPQVRTMRMLCC